METRVRLQLAARDGGTSVPVIRAVDRSVAPVDYCPRVAEVLNGEKVLDR